MKINSLQEAKNLKLDKFKAHEFNFDIDINPDNISGFKSLEFINCTFNYPVKIEKLKKDNLDIIFINCTFKGELNVNENHIRDIKLIWHYKNNDVSKGYCIVHDEKFRISISSNTFNRFCHISGLNHTSKDFYFISNTFLKKPREVIEKRETSYNICEIEKCNITNGSFNNNTFYMPFVFTKNILIYHDNYLGHSFKNNIFQKSTFSYTDFGQKSIFDRCDFLGTTLFDCIKNFNNTKLVISNCKFTGYAHFGEAKIAVLDIQYTTFLKSVSFNKSYFKEINLSEIKFEKSVYFDDIYIEKIIDIYYFKTIKSRRLQKWRHTLRVIKQELLKLDNKIDYNRFRVHEFNAYKEELRQEIKKIKPTIPLNNRLLAKDKHYAKIKRDLIVLKLSKIVSDYGTDWKRALKFLLLSGFLLYSLFFISENYMYTFDITNCKEFVSGYFRFLLVTDFYNPLIKEREFLTEPLSWLIFILGKIVIAFGIYEMIQSFRKFKA